jgi:hypothetical protein
MAYPAYSFTIVSAGAHHTFRGLEGIIRVGVVRVALGIRDDRNRYFAENLATASIRRTLKPTNTRSLAHALV